MLPERITLAQVKTAAMKAHKKGLLLAQHPDEETYCYFDKRTGFGCAIGVALSKEANDFITHHGWESLVLRSWDSRINEAFVVPEGERERIMEIQSEA